MTPEPLLVTFFFTATFICCVIAAVRHRYGAMFWLSCVGAFYCGLFAFALWLSWYLMLT